MAITKEKKDEILKGLVDQFVKSKTVIFSDYRGLDVSSISDLRNRLRETGSECKVAKKTLIRLAAKEIDVNELGADVMDGPVAVTFSYEDELAGLKVLFKFSGENDKLRLLGGIIDGKVIGADEIIQLAKLPGKQELYAKLLGSMNAPVSGFVGIMSNLLSGFVRVLDAYKDTLPADNNPVPEVKPAEEPKVEEAPAEPVAEDTKPEEAPAEENGEEKNEEA